MIPPFVPIYLYVSLFPLLSEQLFVKLWFFLPELAVSCLVLESVDQSTQKWQLLRPLFVLSSSKSHPPVTAFAYSQPDASLRSDCYYLSTLIPATAIPFDFSFSGS